MVPNIFTHLPLQRTYITVAMSKVSRSFALVIPWLEEPLQQQIATAYLLCRTLDNIEDCGQPFAWQKVRFAEFKQLLASPTQAPAMLLQWQSFSWPSLSADEAALMTLEGGLPLWLIYAAFPDHLRARFQHWISDMADGMQSLIDPAQSTSIMWHGDIRTQTTVSAYNEYCYFVAGTVGGLGTELMIANYGVTGSVTERLLEGSMACGRALQKTNIIQDFVEDLEGHVCYLPDEWLRQIGHKPLTLAGAPLEWSYAVIQDVLNELSDATEYVRNIPIEAIGYRIACLVCLLPAYQTILSAAQHQPQLFTKEHRIKISREMMAHCLNDAVTLAPDNHAITEYCRELEQAVNQVFLTEPVQS